MDMTVDTHKYGLPDQKKYPMPDPAHVRSAIKFFNYVDPAHEKELAKAILKRIKEYEMSFDDFTVGEDNRFSKYIPESYLEHHGILGQKWGVRRYQNEDGTLTQAGRERLNTTKAKTLNKLNKRSEAEKRRAKQNAADIEDLKKNGAASDIIQTKWAYMDEEEKYEAAKRGGYEASLSQLGDVFFNTLAFQNSVALKQLVKEETADLRKDYDRHIKNAKEFTKRYEDLTMKDIDELASKYGYKEAKRQIKRG